MSGSSLDGLDLAYVQFDEQSGRWNYEILQAECIPYSQDWAERLRNATDLAAKDYLLLHSAYGHYIGSQVNQFIEQHGLQYKVALVSSHGHTSFHMPPQMTGQLGDGAAIAAETGLPVVTDLRAVDVALGGQGAPIVPIGERLLWKDVDLFLNIGGIANISVNTTGNYLAYDICPANRVLNMLAAEKGVEYDEGGRWAATGTVHDELLQQLDRLPYYALPFPKSLANDFGTDTVYPLLKQSGLPVEDLLATYSEHIARQVRSAVEEHLDSINNPSRMLVTGGGAFNDHLIRILTNKLEPFRVAVERPEALLINYKEAMIMALLGVLRWREDLTTLSSVTGARRDSVGGALWTSV